MPGRFYSDLLSGVDSRLGIDWTKDASLKTTAGGYLHPSSGDAFKDQVLKFKTAPKKTVSMEVSKTNESEWKDNKKVPKEKTAAKITCNHDSCDSVWSFANDKFTADVHGKNDDKDYPMDFTFKSEFKPATKSDAPNEWKAKLLWDVSTPDFSGARFFQNFELEHNHNKEWIVRSKTNIDYQDQYSVGAHIEHDTKDFQKIRAQAVCSPDSTDSTFWIRGDAKREFVGAGCDNKLKDNIRHSWEALYCWTDGWKGLYGQPVKLLGGVHYKLSDASTLSAAGEAGENYLVKSAQEHKLDKNWTFALQQRFDSSRAATEGTNPYDIGFSMTYKL